MPNQTSLIELGDNLIRADAIVAVSSVFADVDNGQWKFLILLQGKHEFAVTSEEGESCGDLEKKRKRFLAEWRGVNRTFDKLPLADTLRHGSTT